MSQPIFPRGTTVLVAATVVAVAVGVPASADAGVVVRSAPQSVRAGHLAHLTIAVPAGARSRRLSFAVTGGVRQTSPSATVTRALLTWSWRVASSAHSGIWTLTVSCGVPR